MKSLASGNREALGTLFARHHQTVYALCVRLCGSEAAGEDVTQDVFLPVLERA
jgi:DNA-directed RNA polymerase specialized sigma24 family protein